MCPQVSLFKVKTKAAATERASAVGVVEASPNKLGFLSDEPTGELGKYGLVMICR